MCFELHYPASLTGSLSESQCQMQLPVPEASLPQNLPLLDILPCQGLYQVYAWYSSKGWIYLLYLWPVKLIWDKHGRTQTRLFVHSISLQASAAWVRHLCNNFKEFVPMQTHCRVVDITLWFWQDFFERLLDCRANLVAQSSARNYDSIIQFGVRCPELCSKALNIYLKQRNPLKFVLNFCLQELCHCEALRLQPSEIFRLSLIRTLCSLLSVGSDIINIKKIEQCSVLGLDWSIQEIHRRCRRCNLSWANKYPLFEIKNAQ